MSEKVLFEMRVNHDEHGSHVTVTTSPEWRAYHRQRRRRAPHRDWELHEPAEMDLRRAFAALQSIYDDLYDSGPAAAPAHM